LAGTEADCPFAQLIKQGATEVSLLTATLLSGRWSGQSTHTAAFALVSFAGWFFCAIHKMKKKKKKKILML